MGINRRAVPNQEEYNFVASFETMLNRSSRYSLLSHRYKNVRPEVVKGIGPVYLAANEKTVILTPRVEVRVRQAGMPVARILGLVKETIEDHKRNRLYR